MARLIILVDRTVESESRPELESVGVGTGVRKIWPTPNPAGGDNFERTLMHSPENIEILEEKESGSVYIKSKHHLVIEFRLIKGIAYNFSAIAIVV